MLICHCYAVSDREIEKTIDAGARSEADLLALCLAGRGCGACRPALAEILERRASRGAPVPERRSA